MKKYLLLILAAALVAVCNTTAAPSVPTVPMPSSYEGEPPTEMKMITSLDRLNTYALEQIKAGYKSIWSLHAAYSTGDKSSLFVNASGAIDVLQGIQGELSIHSYSPNEDIYVNSVMFNKKFFPLYSAYATGSVVSKGNGVYGINCPALKLKLNIDSLAIEFPNAVSAYEEYIDENGYTQRLYLTVSAGYILFDGRHLVGDSVAAGLGLRKRTIVVTTYYPDGGPALSPGDGYESAYDGNTGARISMSVIRGIIAVGFDNVIVASDKFLPPASALNMSLVATAAQPLGAYEVTNSPGALVRITAPQGNKRLVTFAVAIPHDFDVTKAEIYAHDKKAMEPGGSGDEQFCNVATGTLSWSKVTVNGNVTTTLNATFLMEGENSDWTIGVKAGPYEAQVIPTSVPYGGGGGAGVVGTTSTGP